MKNPLENPFSNMYDWELIQASQEDGGPDMGLPDGEHYRLLAEELGQRLQTRELLDQKY